MKVRNEIVREGNLYRALADMDRFCAGGVLCDDASTDGTREVLEEFVRSREGWTLLAIAPEEQEFSQEMRIKERMMQELHALARSGVPWDWVWWHDGDEVLAASVSDLSKWFVEARRNENAQGFRFHYTQFWRTEEWARVDDGFDEGSFVKLWRYRRDLSFDVTEGLHRSQFPKQIDPDRCPQTPFEVLHYGNVGKSLVWKAIQYAGGRGGVDRHLHFGHPRSTSLATGVGWDRNIYASEEPRYRKVGTGGGPLPLPFTMEEIRRIRSMESLRDLSGWFTVIVPAFQRADTLGRALDSILAQTYEKWIAIVLDDGSTDATEKVMRQYQDRDPRIFYARYLENRGGVPMNEIGMAMACEATEFWSRLGSDDWWGPHKLEEDVKAFARGASAVFGPYTVMRDGRPSGTGNPKVAPEALHEGLLRGRFACSWANVAVRTEVLREVRARYGQFADPRLRNCEDFLVNARVARIAPWTWRDGEAMDAVWTAAREGGASSPDHAHILAKDEALTRAIILEENKDPVREVWARAAGFPANKEACYPEHARAHDFDGLAGKRVLEYGCGGGSDTESLARRGARVVYVDVVPGNVAATRRRVALAGYADTTEGHVLERSETIPLEDASLDAVSSHGVLHHIEDPRPVLAEFRRLLVPSGRLLIMLYTEHLAKNLAARVAALCARGLSKEEAFGWATDGDGVPYSRSYTEDEGRAFLTEAGFTVTRAVLYSRDEFRTFWAEKS